VSFFGRSLTKKKNPTSTSTSGSSFENFRSNG
jgi:hypothetical protein